MLYLEFNWTANAYQPRFGDSLIDVRGERSFFTLADARHALKLAGLALGSKTDSRTWRIESAALADKRYTIRPEFCGYDKARHVLRFAGEWVASFADKCEAEQAQIEHYDERQRAF